VLLGTAETAAEGVFDPPVRLGERALFKPQNRFASRQ
jgi:hypothetical protein